MAEFVGLISTFFYIAIFARVILSWFPQVDYANPLIRIIFRVTEPILAPIRRFVPRLGTLDISPMIALILLYAIQNILLGAFS